MPDYTLNRSRGVHVEYMGHAVILGPNTREVELTFKVTRDDCPGLSHECSVPIALIAAAPQHAGQIVSQSIYTSELALLEAKKKIQVEESVRKFAEDWDKDHK